MDLFDLAAADDNRRSEPLASRMRPRTLDEIIGQEAIIGKGTQLRRAIEADRIGSIIFYGPPGSGKTTIARLIAHYTKAEFHSLSAVSAGVADVKKVIADAADLRKMYRKKTILFVDEIHRFNKAQQDALLSAVEEGIIGLIGATTANPFFDVNSALLSRARIYKLEPLTAASLESILRRAITDKERGLGELPLEIEAEAMRHLINSANGDARKALNGLELAALTTPPGENGKIQLTLEIIAEAMQSKALRYDKDGDQHYDIISAFIKSMRGSDPDAALFWLAAMLAAGESPRFIARRVVICASEDVGNADPMALLVATAAAQAVELIGLPEARINLAQAVSYVAAAAKSNASYKAYEAAAAAVEQADNIEVPPHLRDASYQGAISFGHGQGYQYAHDYPEHFVKQQYLPTALQGSSFYQPTENGQEAKIKERLRRLWRDRYDS
ncbi:MAG: replication-associated recombination protein A [Negativicutes bacterium]|nr:replication-associated recombination protein A [Negativicutes bacterium]